MYSSDMRAYSLPICHFLRTLSDLQDYLDFDHEKEYDPMEESDDLCDTHVCTSYLAEIRAKRR